MLDELNKIKANEEKNISETKEDANELKGVLEAKNDAFELKNINEIDSSTITVEKKEDNDLKDKLDKLEPSSSSSTSSSGSSGSQASSSVGGSAAGAAGGIAAVAAVAFVAVGGGGLIGNGKIECSIECIPAETECEVKLDVLANEVQKDITIKISGAEYSLSYIVFYNEQEINEDGSYSLELIFDDFTPGEAYTTIVQADLEFGTTTIASTTFSTAKHIPTTCFKSLTDLGYSAALSTWSFMFNYLDDNNYYDSFYITLESGITKELLTKEITKDKSLGKITFDVNDSFISDKNKLTIYFNTSRPEMFPTLAETNSARGVLKQVYVVIRGE